MRDELSANLKAHVGFLAGELGVRSYRDAKKLGHAADYVEEKLRSFGCEVSRQPFEFEGRTYYNVTGEVGKPSPQEGVFVVGAHYDTVEGSPGADDNASGMAGMLELARLAASSPSPAATRFVAFCLEEPPAFRSSRMGSAVYAKALRTGGVRVRGMVSLEMIGYFTDTEGSQFYPLSVFRWFYPRKGDFIAMVGNVASRDFTNEIKRGFRRNSKLPVFSLNTVSVVPGVDFSDHRSFWKAGYPAFMVTDTAFYRNPNYHSPGDVPDTLDYGRMAEVVRGLHGAFALMGEG